MYNENLGKSKREETTSFSLKDIFGFWKNTKNIFSKERKDIQYYRNKLIKNGHYPIFNQVQIETRTDCNLRCNFCPQGNYQRSLEVMGENTYKLIIDELADLGWSGRIALFMTNEPLLDERLLEFIKYAREKSGSFFIDINSNGYKLTSDKLDSMFKLGLDNININDYRPDRNKYPLKLTKNIQKIEDKFQNNPKVDIFRRRTTEVLSNRAGSVKKSHKKKIKNRFCNYPFRKLSISPKGDVVLCCFDYDYQEKIGNVHHQNLLEIWESEKMNKIRTSLLKRSREGLCSSCDINDYPKASDNVRKLIEKLKLSLFKS